MRNSQECCHEWADWLHLILKYLLLMAVGLVATSGWADVLVPKGQHWQEGFEWKCPNCDKENSVDKTEYRHRNESPEK